MKKYFNATYFADIAEAKIARAAMMHGMTIAALQTFKCDTIYFDNKEYIKKENLIKYLKGKKYRKVNELSHNMTEEEEKELQWELSRNTFINNLISYLEKEEK